MVQNIIEGKLAIARQELTEEMKRLYKSLPKKMTRSVGGIPVDSEYIVFIIDTSGSMQRNAWRLVQKKMRETLEIYPKVKGIQIMNDMGNFLFSQYAGNGYRTPPLDAGPSYQPCVPGTLLATAARWKVLPQRSICFIRKIKK